MRVADVMTRGVISLGPDDSVQKAARLMLQYGVSGFPVLAHGNLVGIVSQGDFLRRAEIGIERPRSRSTELPATPGQLAEEYARTHGRKVGEVMTRDLVTVTEDASVEEAARLMESNHIKRLPVVRGDALIGLISRVDLLHAFIVGSPKADTAPVSDAAIRDALEAMLEKEPWVPHGSVNAIVKNGLVVFVGVIDDERQRTALRVAAENIAGVKEVCDQRLTVDPGAGHTA